MSKPLEARKYLIDAKLIPVTEKKHKVMEVKEQALVDLRVQSKN